MNPSAATVKSMKGNKRTGTRPELAVRRALWAAGLRGYRVDTKKLPGRPDIVFNRAKIAIFVHGCFWHQCPTCRRNLTPTNNAGKWAEKFRRNRERDAEKQAELESRGYRVMVVWECRIKGDLDRIVAEVGEALGEKANGRES